MASAALIAGAAPVAQAEPAPEIRATTDDDGKSPDAPISDTFLHLDTNLVLNVDRLQLVTHHFDRQLRLGGVRVSVDTQWRDVDHDVPVRGWHTQISGRYDVGPVSIATNLGLEHVDTDLGRNTLMTAGIGVGRKFRLSRSVRGWVGLSLGFRQWLGKPPPGEANGGQAMVTAKLSY
jgi:hypothetical protein